MDIRIPKDPERRAALAKFAGLTEEERLALDKWCDLQASKDEARRRRGLEATADRPMAEGNPYIVLLNAVDTWLSRPRGAAADGELIHALIAAGHPLASSRDLAEEIVAWESAVAEDEESWQQCPLRPRSFRLRGTGMELDPPKPDIVEGYAFTARIVEGWIDPPDGVRVVFIEDCRRLVAAEREKTEELEDLLRLILSHPNGVMLPATITPRQEELLTRYEEPDA